MKRERTVVRFKCEACPTESDWLGWDGDPEFPEGWAVYRVPIGEGCKERHYCPAHLPMVRHENR